MRRRRSTILVAVGIGAALSACGSSDPTPTAGERSTTSSAPSADTSANDVHVVARDISLAAKEYTAAAGAVHVTYRNEGSIEHSLRIEDVDGFRLDVATKGAQDEGTVDLAAGTYTIFCDIPGHRQAGMHAQLVVDGGKDAA